MGRPDRCHFRTLNKRTTYTIVPDYFLQAVCILCCVASAFGTLVLYAIKTIPTVCHAFAMRPRVDYVYANVHYLESLLLFVLGNLFSTFVFQYEAFCLHLCCGETKEAAKSLADLYVG